MSKGHKDLPSGSQNWAGDVAAQLVKIAELEGIVRRLVNDFGLDYSNPQRGLNTGSTPSVANPVQLKLPSLKDLDIRDAQDGDLLTFDGKRGVWTARRHDTVVQPKTFPQGDPASYYVAPAPVLTTPADTWSAQNSYTNYFLDPGCEEHPEYWVAGANTNTNTAVAASLTIDSHSGSKGMKLEFSNTSPVFAQQYATAQSHELPLTTRVVSAWVRGRSDGRSVVLYLTFRSASGNYTNWASDPVTVGEGQWQQLTVSGSSGADPVSCVAQIGISDVSTSGTSIVVIDDLFAGTSAAPGNTNFNGSTTGGQGYAYAWTGAVNNSTSTATTTQQIQFPAVITLGKAFQVNGRGFIPGQSVDVNEPSWYSASSVVAADSNGEFSTTLTIPANTNPAVGPVAGPGYLTATNSGPLSPFVDVTFI